MMLRADIISDVARLPGRGEQQYKGTIQRAAKACGIEDMTALLTISVNKLVFNKYMKEVAQTTFLEKWIAKETHLREQRRAYELRRADNERSLVWEQNSIAHQALEYADSESDEETNEVEQENIDTNPLTARNFINTWLVMEQDRQSESQESTNTIHNTTLNAGSREQIEYIA